MKTTAIIIIYVLLFSSSLWALENPSILYVGDSHSYGKLGTTIEKNLSSLSSRVVMESSCGATPNTWLGSAKYARTVCGFWKKDGKEEVRSKEHQTPKFADELAKYRPEITIVQLGTNIAAGPKPGLAGQSIVAMMNLIKAEKSECIWIGPPDANSKIVTKAKLLETNQLLKDLSQTHGCHYIDSLALTTFPTENKEGIHYPPSLSGAWGEKVSLQLLKIISAL